ncbi:oxidoreductase [Leptospira semungkisensis]|uniref:Oxidoreductase n=1 Tax=Leptospira semungkisensis TaxID=2484985 RepID=A0A4R9G1N8_9LEPT|nr:aldo/keto reductase [Leptospira semungkisensis]TGK04925.1 oxidoreductase [Leptospira semungkisensis]
MIPSIDLQEGGPSLSRIVYGCWRLHSDPNGSGQERILEKIEVCLELGIHSFDHADIYGDYGNEEKFGLALQSKPGIKDKIKVITKCGIQLPGPNRAGVSLKYYDTSKDYVIQSAEASLKKLRTDKIDLLLIHRPDPFMDADSTAEGFRKLKEQGKVLHFGVSNFTPSQFRLLQSRLDFPLVTNQVEFHPLFSDALINGIFEQAQELRFRPMVWSPTAGGRIFHPKTEREIAVNNTLQSLAKKKGISPDAILYAWLLLHPTKLIPVLGTNEPSRIRSAARAFEVQLTKEEWFEILEAGVGQPVP